MSRVKTFDSTGIATAGRLYAGDVNAIQDQYADLFNLAQALGISTVAIGEAGLQLLRYGAGEARLSGALRTDGILRALSGLYAGAYTTTARDAIALGSRPFGLIILNTTTNRYEWNSGTDPSPVWTPLGGGSFLQGTAGTRPGFSASNANTFYFETDVNGGTLTVSTGTAWVKVAPGLTETPTIPAGTITSAMILDGTILAGDMAAGAALGNIAADSITATQIAANAIGASELADLSVDTAALQDGAVTQVKHAANSVGSAQIIDNSVNGSTSDHVTREIVQGTISRVDLVQSELSPTGGAGAGVEALRALGTTGATAAAGNDSRFSAVTINPQVASYTLVLADAGKDVEISNGSAVTLTVPPNSSVAFPIGTVISITQTGAGQITVAPGAGVTINGNPGLKLVGQWAMASLVKRATDTWILAGNITP